MRLTGKRVVITGSSSGIGRSIALLIAKEGASVVVNARGTGESGTKAIDDVVSEIRSAGGVAIGVPGAVNNRAFAEELVASCIREFGGIDILINNAGAYGSESVAECPLDTWHQLMDVNLNSAFYTSHFALPQMMRQRWGRIINASSFAGTGLLGGSAYAASKAALLGLTRAIAADYGSYGITANAYSPQALTQMGGVGSEHRVLVGMMERWRNRGYLNDAELAYRIGIAGPDGIAPWVTYLCLEEAAFLNGQVFAVESRRVAMLPWPDETRILYRDAQRQGPWKIDELCGMAPLAFPVRNAWPRRTEEDLRQWEAT
jgi:3-oxoacyl-[acyl-carrier protein] reductase